VIRSCILLLVIPIYTVVASLVAIPVAFVSRSPAILYRLGRWGLRLGFGIAGVSVRVRGRESLPPRPHFIYMVNHVSNLDAPIAVLHLPGHIKAMAKKEVFRLPVLATVLRMAGFVSVDRSRRSDAIRSMQLAAERARDGASFFLAPEGKRSPDGRLLPFKKGGFHLAIESGVPILPLTLRGTRDLMPRGSFSVRPGAVELIFHEPVPTEGLGPDHLPSLMEEVRRRIESGLTADGGPRGTSIG
jgi:1-acyl-sn-glycerol-3-phosphate acyltransferase